MHGRSNSPPRVGRVAAVFSWLLIAPALASAQGSITGAARDTSGAVLPGVTVEASSAALIEKTRAVITDGTGQYRIVDLRPGTYTVTFTLTGFTTVKREAVELTGSFTATVNAEMRVGAVTETITVSGETPLVDVQSTTREHVVDHSVIDTIPTGRLPTQLAILIPGVTNAGTVGFNGMTAQDVGGAGGDQQVTLQIHGSRGNDQRIMINGMNIGWSNTSMWTAYSPNLGATAEVAVDTAAASAEAQEGGVRINLIPREGGNAFRGTLFAGFANDSMTADNLTDDLKQRGLTVANSVKKVADFNPGFGGPIKKDRLWFYTSFRTQIADNWAGGMYVDTTANDPNIWSFNPDKTRPVSNDATWKVGDVRLTWQASAKHKIGFGFAREQQCKCPSFLGATESTGINNKWGEPHHMETLEWSSPLTSRVLVEAGVLNQYTRWGWFPLDNLNPNIIGFTEQSTGILSKVGWLPFFSDHWYHDVRYRAALSYVTGAHAFKVGFSNGHGDSDTLTYNGTAYGGGIPLDYRFNFGVPNLITLRATPYHNLWHLDSQLGVFAQDRWTVAQLTLTGGVRFDYQKAHFPAQTLGPAPLAPTRNIAIPDTPNVSWKDVTPKMGAVYDLLGNGRTAVKISLNKYVDGASGSALGDPVNNLVTNTTRSWSDRNGLGIDGDYIPQCDLTNPARNGECGQMANTNFGKTVPGSVFDPAVLGGWGNRFSNWEFSLGAQHRILPRVSVDVSYFRRWYSNFLATDNRALVASDYDAFSIPAPSNLQLPDGGGYRIGGLYNLNPLKFGVPADNLITFADAYGTQIEHWNGLDVTINTRPRQGVLLQAGASSGRTSTDNCAVVSRLPGLIATAVSATPLQYCHVDTPFLTQVKGFAAYTIPRVDVQVSGAFQSAPGPQISANYPAPLSVVLPSLGRPLSGGQQNVTVNLITPGSLYGERMHQLDLRVGKSLKYGRTRTAVNIDLYNALNSSAVLTESSAYSNWRTPQVILVGRFAKLTVQFDF
jgi:hypothetical protein